MSSNESSSGNPVQYAVRLRERAIRDIDAAYVRFAEIVSEVAANEWRNELVQALATLATLRRRYPVAPGRFRQEVRQMVYSGPG